MSKTSDQEYLDTLANEDLVPVSKYLGPGSYESRYIKAQELRKAINREYDAVVSNDANTADDTSVAAAFTAGAKTVFVRRGTYIETADIVIPEGGGLTGEDPSLVIIVLAAGNQVKSDGNAGVKESAGTISLTSGTTTVTGVGTTFTNLATGDYIQLDTGYFEIDSITDNTSLELKDAFQGKALSNSSWEGQSMLTGVSIHGVTLANGSNGGIYLRGVRHAVINEVVVSGCTGNNIEVVDGADILIQAAVTQHATAAGLRLGNCATVSIHGISSKNNGTDGVLIDNSVGSILEGSNVSFNGGYGAQVTGTSNSLTFTDCITRSNVSGGLKTTANTSAILLNSCLVINNGGAGVSFAGSGDLCNDCIIHDNSGDGVVASAECVIDGNHIYDNGGKGIDVTTGDDFLITSNVVNSNTAEGIKITKHQGIIFSNRVSSNGGKGIEVVAGATDNILTNNNAKGNTGTDLDDQGTSTTKANNKNNV
jgi:parallel beta-helix repeat protein